MSRCGSRMLRQPPGTEHGRPDPSQLTVASMKTLAAAGGRHRRRIWLTAVIESGVGRRRVALGPRHGRAVPDASGTLAPHDLYVETYLWGRGVDEAQGVGAALDRDRRALDGSGCGYPVELIHGCAHAFLAGVPFRGADLVCSDPQHLRATRKSAARTARANRKPGWQGSRSKSRDASGPGSMPRHGHGSQAVSARWSRPATIPSSPFQIALAGNAADMIKMHNPEHASRKE